MINATALNLVGLGGFGLAGQPVNVYRVNGSALTHLRADRQWPHWKMIPIKNNERQPAEWMPLHLINV